jgi:hypothetical protein
LSAQQHEFICPYCPRKSASPGGVKFHVKLTHPEKLDEFSSVHFPKMASRFKELNPET